ncbi:MAG: hypothetical protein U1F43_21550 [Myxococcota bacterium]
MPFVGWATMMTPATARSRGRGRSRPRWARATARGRRRRRRRDRVDAAPHEDAARRHQARAEVVVGAPVEAAEPAAEARALGAGRGVEADQHVAVARLPVEERQRRVDVGDAPRQRVGRVVEHPGRSQARDVVGARAGAGLGDDESDDESQASGRDDSGGALHAPATGGAARVIPRACARAYAARQTRMATHTRGALVALSIAVGAVGMLAACGGSERGAASAEELTRRLEAALKDGDGVAFERLLLRSEAVGAACPTVKDLSRLDAAAEQGRATFAACQALPWREAKLGAEAPKVDEPVAECPRGLATGRFEHHYASGAHALWVSFTPVRVGDRFYIGDRFDCMDDSGG